MLCEIYPCKSFLILFHEDHHSFSRYHVIEINPSDGKYNEKNTQACSSKESLKNSNTTNRALKYEDEAQNNSPNNITTELSLAVIDFGQPLGTYRRYSVTQINPSDGKYNDKNTQACPSKESLKNSNTANRPLKYYDETQNNSPNNIITTALSSVIDFGQLSVNYHQK